MLFPPPESERREGTGGSKCQAPTPLTSRATNTSQLFAHKVLPSMGPCPDVWGEGGVKPQRCVQVQAGCQRELQRVGVCGCLAGGFSKWAATLKSHGHDLDSRIRRLAWVPPVRRAGNKAPRVVSRPGQASLQRLTFGLARGSSPLESSRTVASRP